MTDSITNYDISAISFKLQKNYLQNYAVELREMICRSSSKQEITRELSAIKRQLKRPVVPIQRYAKTKHAAVFLDVDSSFLDKKRKEGIFIEGKHYFKPRGCSLVLWDIDALGKWVTTTGGDNDNNSDIIDSMFK